MLPLSRRKATAEDEAACTAAVYEEYTDDEVLFIRIVSPPPERCRLNGAGSAALAVEDEVPTQPVEMEDEEDEDDAELQAALAQEAEDMARVTAAQKAQAGSQKRVEELMKKRHRESAVKREQAATAAMAD